MYLCVESLDYYAFEELLKIAETQIAVGRWMKTMWCIHRHAHNVLTHTCSRISLILFKIKEGLQLAVPLNPEDIVLSGRRQCPEGII